MDKVSTRVFVCVNGAGEQFYYAIYYTFSSYSMARMYLWNVLCLRYENGPRSWNIVRNALNLLLSFTGRKRIEIEIERHVQSFCWWAIFTTTMLSSFLFPDNFLPRPDYT